METNKMVISDIDSAIKDIDKDVSQIDDRIYYDKKTGWNVVFKGKFRGHKIIICSCNGEYPTAYVEVPNEYGDKTFSDFNIAVHGGITFCGKLRIKEVKGLTCIGWDYAHYGDYYNNSLSINFMRGKAHTVGEIVQDCIDVINKATDLGMFN